MRIASLVPSTTEIVAALGYGGHLVARTHECDHPGTVAGVPAVTTDLLPAGMAPSEIDAAVAASVADEHTIYALDAPALAATAPDVILTQATCAVCAVDLPAVRAATCTMPHDSTVFSFDPTRLADVVDGIADVGEAIGAHRQGLALRAHLQQRCDWLRGRLAGRPTPRVAVVEWPDPLYAPGHWVPDMVELAGGRSVFGEPGGRSVRTGWDDLAAADPDVIVMAFCGYDLATTTRLTDELLAGPMWQEHGLGAVPVAAFDGSAYFSRPGPRLLDGVEALAWLLHRPHPDLLPRPGVGALRSHSGWTDMNDPALPRLETSRTA